jgi:hypothetical protein
MPRELDDQDDDLPKKKRKAQRVYDDDDDDDDDYEHPEDRRARSKGDATGGIIPYKNAKALTSYYTGVFSLIPCLGGILAPIALIFGILGLSHAKKYPESKGTAHAIVGIILGTLVLLGHLAAVVMIVISAQR